MTALAPPDILIVEDDPSLRKLIRSHLEAAGMQVREASEAQSALALLAERVPDLICLDLMLPQFSGYSICETVRKDPALAELPLLVISARTLPEDRAQAEEAGANGYLTKPFTRAQLLGQVQALLEKPAGETAP